MNKDNKDIENSDKIEIMDDKKLRQDLSVAVDVLKDDLRTLLRIRHRNPVYAPIVKIIHQLKALKDVLSHYPEASCPECKHVLN